MAPTLREQLLVLGAPETVPERLFELYAGYASAPAPKPEFEPVEAEESMFRIALRPRLAAMILSAAMWNWIAAAVACARFMMTTRPASAFTPSMITGIVSPAAAPGTRSSFYMTYQQRVEGQECDFKTAVTELAEMLLK